MRNRITFAYYTYDSTLPINMRISYVANFAVVTGISAAVISILVIIT